MGDSGKLRFYELNHKSKTWLLKTCSHTSNGLAMERGTREEKQLKETDPTTRPKSPIENLPRAAGVAGGGRKGSRTCGIPPVWRGAAGKALRQVLPSTPFVRLLGGDTECAVQVCQLSRSSESTHFLCLRRDVTLFDSTRAPDDF